MSLKKFVAFDEADLAVMSAYVQDATLSASDVAYLPQERRFALVASRFCRESGAEETETRHVGLHFESVTGVRSFGVTPGGAEKLQLLALLFSAGAEPAGTVQLLFAGSAEIRLEVECLEAFMSDLDENGPKECCPRHSLSA